MYELIERINEAADVKKFKAEELDQLAVEIRAKVSMIFLM